MSEHNPLSFLNDGDKTDVIEGAATVVETPAPEAAAAAPEAPAVAAPEPQPDAEGRLRRPDGTFAPKPTDGAAEVAKPAQATPATQAPTPAPTAAPEGYAPVAALQEERTKRQELERRLEALSQGPTVVVAPPAPIAAPAATVAGPARDLIALPDRVDDPDGYADALHTNSVRRITAASWDYAMRTADKPTVEAAWTWGVDRAGRDASFSTALFDSNDPVGLMLAEHRRHLAIERIASLTPDALERLLTGQAAAPTPDGAASAAAPPAPSPPPNPAAAPPSPVTPPPRSIAGETSAGGMAHVPVGPKEAYDGIFQKG